MPIIENQFLFKKLRDQYPEFIYESVQFDITERSLTLSWVFRCNEIVFNPQSIIPYHKEFQKLSPEKIFNYAFQIGMIELISYWKACCSPIIVIKPSFLDEESIAFWKKIYYNGLGEFFYLNNIETTFEEFVSIKPSNSKTCIIDTSPLSNRILIPIGGGKDSVVTLQILKDNNHVNNIMPIIMNPRGATLNTLKASGVDKFIEINRQIDPQIIELNSKGYLNGHTPFSAMLAFYTVLIARFFDYKHIALSNESSANEPTVLGTEINHQYSKSIEFENDFRKYINKYIHPDINYFSFLRPLSEIQIASLFAQYTQYHLAFRSCNAGSKTDVWCGKCPKCLFTYILLSAFLTNEKLIEIFGSNLLNNNDLIEILDELTGIKNIKPFECVGTTEEVRLSLRKHLINQNYTNAPILLQHFLLNESQNSNNSDFETHLLTLDSNNNLPPDLYLQLEKTIHERIYQTCH